uniref:TRAF-type domain-containing protein n=1 Tax=Mesocestoides corti TaxID=53468 RepID=A0A5K3EVC4_MESCO
MQMKKFLEHFAEYIPSELVECICKRIQQGAHTDTNASVKNDETPADIAHSDPRPSGCEEGNEGQNQTIDSYSALDVPEVEVEQSEIEPKPYLKCYELKMCKFLEHFANCIPPELMECICKRIQQGAHTDTNACVKDDETPADIAHYEPRPSGCEERNECQNQTIDSYSALDLLEVNEKDEEQLKHEPEHYMDCGEIKMRKFLEHFAEYIPPELLECICKRIQHGTHTDTNACVKDDETPADIAHYEPRPSECEGKGCKDQTVDNNSSLDRPEVEKEKQARVPEHHVECGEMQMRRFLELFAEYIPRELAECICERIQKSQNDMGRN